MHNACCTCPAEEILPGPDKSHDVSISLLVPSQWNRGGRGCGGGEGPEMYKWLLWHENAVILCFSFFLTVHNPNAEMKRATMESLCCWNKSTRV